MAIMVDIETWSTEDGAAIRSIGAVRFSLRTHEVSDDTFYVNIQDPSGLRSESTIDWWSRQGEEACEAFHTPEPIPEKQALLDFAVWGTGKGDTWANGTDFDLTNIKAAYNRMHMTYPMAFWSHRCCRPVLDWAQIPRNAHPPKIKHHALHDAISQALKVCDAHKVLVR